MHERRFCVYIMASVSGTLYVGVTNDLVRRVHEHRTGAIPGFAKEYSCRKLVYFETFETATDAIAREKQLKKWRREKKEFLIRTMNRGWRDMWEGII